MAEQDEDLGNSIAYPRSEQSCGAIADALNEWLNLEEITFQESAYVPDSTIKPYNPDELVQKKGDYSIYEDMIKDDQVAVALQLKKDLVLAGGFDIVVEDDDEQSVQIKEFLEVALNEDPLIPIEESLQEMLTAYEFGFSLSEKIFRYRDDNMLTLKCIKTRHPASWLIHQDNKGNVCTYEQRADASSVAIPGGALIHYINEPRFQNPYGSSDLRAAFSAWLVKTEVIKYYAIFLEKGASPTPVARYDKAAPQSAVDAIFNTIKKFQAKTAMVIPKEIEVEFIETKSNGEAFRHAINIFNMFIGRALFIPDLLGFQGSETSGGSYSLGKEQMGVLFKHIGKRRATLERIINKEIIKPLVKHNFGDVEHYPKFRLRPVRDEELIELAKLWLDAAKSRVFKANDEEINHFRKLAKFPEGEVESESIEPVVPQGQDGVGEDAAESSISDGTSIVDEEVVEDIQRLALNGAQVAALVDIVVKVATGLLPRDAAVEIIAAAFQLDPAQSEKLLGTVGDGFKPKLVDISGNSQEEARPNDPPMPVKKTAKKKEYKLPPGDYHKKVDFKKLENTLDAYKDGVLMEALPIVRKIFKDVAVQLRKKKIIETQNLGKIESVKFKFKGELVRSLNRSFRDAFREAEKTAEFELDKGANKKKLAIPLLDEAFMEVLKQETWAYVGDWEFNVKKDLRLDLAAAIKDGRPLSSVIDSVLDDVGMELSEESIERFARTKFTEVTNRGRHATFEASGVVDAYQYSAILDERTSDVCEGLDGKIFKSGSEPIPPLHFNCRSLLIPITKYEEYEADDKVGKEDIDDFIEDNIGKGFSRQ